MKTWSVVDWARVSGDLDARGYATIPRLLAPAGCDALVALYDVEGLFRSRVVFAVHQRPVQGTRRVYRVNLRHGVSRLRSGHRHTVGVIFHDAKNTGTDGTSVKNS